MLVMLVVQCLVFFGIMFFEELAVENKVNKAVDWRAESVIITGFFGAW